LAKPALVLVSVISFFLSGCSGKIEPTYKEEDIPYIIRKICQEEYNLDVTTQRTHNTLWVYAPMDKMLSKDYGIKEDKIFDEEIMDKMRNILTTIGRVLISSNNTPEFFALVVSDINVGIDYTMIGYVLDTKKSYADFIPWPEANRRYVIKFNIAPSAVGDTTGLHFTPYDIDMPDFLSEQIAQRISARLQDDGLKKYLKVEKCEGKFENGVFSFDYSVTEIAKPKTKIAIKEEMLKIITYCLKTYEFRSFSGVVLTDLNTFEKTDLNKTAILSRTESL